MRLTIVATLSLSGLFVVAASADSQPVTAGAASGLNAELAAALSQNVNRPVIVMMRNAFTGALAATDQGPLMSELHQVGATHIKPFRLVNAFAATVSDGELARLRANPAVQAVAPDVMIHHATHSRAQSQAQARGRAATTASPNLNVIAGACPKAGRVQLNPEALQTTNTASDNPKAKTARSLGATGAGVKVAWIADGIDPQSANFIRPDGSSVFVDYQDFTGDGPGQPTGGGEAFLDSNSIAGQGIVTYDVNGYSAQSLPGPCLIRIEGVAPGASLVGLDVFGSFESTTESNFLQAIDYAVTVDHVDVLNESFGSNEFPDVTSLDATKQFDEAAVRAGVTVTVSSGDAGATNTIGSPATDPLLLSVGATTTFRLYAQTNYAATRYFATGWLDDNISDLSSGGFSETGGTVDLVAPGDLNWVSCEASATYADCTNFLGVPSNFADSGGTSESAPLTAGAAALVIEAYRSTHGGASPTPALVKQILTSTASDLGAPAAEQGSGILDTYNAVLLARSLGTGAVKPSPSGQTLLLSAAQLNAVGRPGSAQSWTVRVTNTGAASQTVQLAGRTLGPDQNVQSGSAAFADGADPQFVTSSGITENYAQFTFHVPPGADRLSAALAYPTSPGNRAGQLILVGPHGKLAAYTLPQGVGNSGIVDVRKPAPGTWTGVLFARSATTGGPTGTIRWQVATQQYVPFATVSPTSLSLAVGQSQTVQVSASTPAQPGDQSGSIVLTSSTAGTDPYLGTESNSIAVTLRSLVDAQRGGSFAGVLTGGNGRAPGLGQVQFYEFRVPAGTSGITANLSLTNDLADNVGAYLIGPDGSARGFGQNSTGGINGPSLTAATVNPDPGLWKLVVDFAEPVVGDEISQPFAGTISLDAVGAVAAGLPNDAATTLTAGVPVSVPVSVTNRGAAPELVFLDARLSASARMKLASLNPPATSAGYTLPLTATSPAPEWLVPTQTSGIALTARATLPVEFDYGPFQGDPDLFAPPTAPNDAAGSFVPSGGTVQQGGWFAEPDEIGPYKGPAPSGRVKMTLVATAKPFDPAVSSPTGDLWFLSVGQPGNFSPVTLNPGQSTTIDVTITPEGKPGQVVSGVLYVDSFLSGVPPYGVFTGNEVAALPYSYTIGAAAAESASVK